MKPIQSKLTTLRTAGAEAVLKATEEAISACRSGNTPKGPVIDIARAAGIMAAKKTPDLIPYCHPIEIDHVAVEIRCEDVIRVTTRVTAIAKTGVEMEALTAASVAALTVYDMLKPIDSSIEILHTRLVSKCGGKSDFAGLSGEGLRAAILITSDKCSRDTSLDTTGPLIRDCLKGWQVDVIGPLILPDDRVQIEARIKSWCKEGTHLIITSGGTGIGMRDTTVEATRAVIEREIPGIAEALRAYGLARKSNAMFSRCIAGLCGKTLIVNLPGSKNAVEDGLSVLFPAVFHIFEMLEGKPHP